MKAVPDKMFDELDSRIFAGVHDGAGQQQPQLEPGSLDVRWNEGVRNCTRSTPPPLQVHRYNANTYVLRQNPCATYEAPFLYLLIGTHRALLIDSGAVAEVRMMPLANTVMGLLPDVGGAKLPLTIVHTHSHLDHRAGDVLFQQLPDVTVAAADLDGVRTFFGFADWPNSEAQIDLGDRIVDVIPPGTALRTWVTTTARPRCSSQAIS